MKKMFLVITMALAFIIVIGEVEKMTIGIITLKIISIIYLYIIAKINNYFYE